MRKRPLRSPVTALAKRTLHSTLDYRIHRPVFVIAPPRSGSTLLFELLSLFEGLACFTGRESEHIWHRILPYHKRTTFSDYAHPDELGSVRRRRLKAAFYNEATKAMALRSGTRRTPHEIIGRTWIRYLDKTISNCFHLDVLSEMFPDATLVYLYREPRQNIASMMEGWQERKFRKEALSRFVEALPGATVPHWAYPAPPGWQGVLAWDLHEVCAWSWQQHVEWMLEYQARAQLPIHEVRYEQLVASPIDVLSGLITDLGLEWKDEVRDKVEAAPLSRTTVTPPAPDKWRRVQPDVESAMPMVRETVRRLDYAIE